KQSRKHKQSAEVPGEPELQEKLPEEAPPRYDQLSSMQQFTKVSDKATSPIASLTSPDTPTATQFPAASSSSFPVNALPSWDWKPPTVAECQIIIHQLWSINQMQAQQVPPKLLFPELLAAQHNHCIFLQQSNQSMYLQTFLFRNPEVTRLPKVPHKDTPRKSLVAAPVPLGKKAILPPLKQTLGNSFVERQKRTQAVQRSRLHRTAF
uniref:Coiled coil protein 74 C-terminal domain-containing protein n=1 Tax=Nothoprocta perdicaria TaxID=30464 RepID=A0A8C6ZEH4_NOTPE